MRTSSAVVGLLAGVVAFASCAPRQPRAAGPSAASAPARPVVLRGEPTCTFRVLGRIAGASPDTYNSTPLAKAKALGADAVMDFRSTPTFDATGRQNGSTWEAIAIDYSDSSDPNCGRAGESRGSR